MLDPGVVSCLVYGVPEIRHQSTNQSISQSVNHLYRKNHFLDYSSSHIIPLSLASS